MLDTRKIKICSSILPPPADEIVMNMALEIELLREYVQHLLVCGVCAEATGDCKKGREIEGYFEEK